MGTLRHYTIVDSIAYILFHNNKKRIFFGFFCANIIKIYYFVKYFYLFFHLLLFDNIHAKKVYFFIYKE